MLNFLKNIFNHSKPSSLPFSYDQAMLLAIRLEGEDPTFWKAIESLEKELEKVLPKNAGIDGHEFGDGECIIYIYGPDAKELFANTKSVLKKSNFSRIDVTLQFGEPDDPTTKTQEFTL